MVKYGWYSHKAYENNGCYVYKSNNGDIIRCTSVTNSYECPYSVESVYRQDCILVGEIEIYNFNYRIYPMEPMRTPKIKEISLENQLNQLNENIKKETMDLMDIVDNIRDKISDGDYLKISNKLLSLYELV